MDESQESRVKLYMGLFREAWDTFGLPTILLAIVLALWIGWLPSPLSEAKDTLEQLRAVTQQHVDRDEQLLYYMKQSCVGNMKLAQMPLDSCNWWPGRPSP